MRGRGLALAGVVALSALLGLLLIQTRPSEPAENEGTTGGATWSTTIGKTTRRETSTSRSQTTSESTATTALTYMHNMTVLSFEVHVYNYTHDNETLRGEAFVSWILTATSATNYSFTSGVKQYESAAGDEIVGYYRMPLKPGQSSVLRSEVFKVSFVGGREEMLHGDRSFKVVFSYPPEEKGYSVGWYKAKMIYFNLSGDWSVFVLRPSD